MDLMFIGSERVNYCLPPLPKVKSAPPRGSDSSPAQKDPYIDLVSLQKAAGYWDMESKLLHVFGKTDEEVTKQMPAQWGTFLNVSRLQMLCLGVR
ncbi:hypothetical protein MHYP_G00127660 [Metynnis hypsauchen]